MKYFIITKRGIFIAVMLVLTGIILIAALGGERSVSTAAGTKRSIPVYCVQTDEKKLAVTFDAAWGAEDTQQLIEILKEYNAKATFFVVGTWAEKYPDSVKAFYDAGHEIANHSYDHTLYGKLPKQHIKEDIEKCNSAIQSITGEKPRLLRAPSGEYNEDSEAAAAELGMRTVQWSVDSLDWQGLSSEDIVRRVLNASENGSILLFHNDVKNTPAALKEILSELSEKGFSFVSVSELLYSDNYIIDATGRQIKAE